MKQRICGKEQKFRIFKKTDEYIELNSYKHLCRQLFIRKDVMNRHKQKKITVNIITESCNKETQRQKNNPKYLSKSCNKKTQTEKITIYQKLMMNYDKKTLTKNNHISKIYNEKT